MCNEKEMRSKMSDNQVLVPLANLVAQREVNTQEIYIISKT